MKVNGQVIATDASESEDGGGACVSIGLTKWGFARTQTLARELGGLEGAGRLLGFEPLALVGVDTSPEASRIMRQHHRHILWYDSVEKVTHKELIEIRQRFPRAKRVLLSGGWPCVNHSQLNSMRGGAEAASSQLLDELIRVRDSLTKVSGEVHLPPWEEIEFFENVVMDDHDYEVQTRKIGYGALHFELLDQE